MAVEEADIEEETRVEEIAPEEWTIRDADARLYVERATETIASLVRSTFGPRGMEKLVMTEDLQGVPEIVQTADANELLDAIQRGDGFNHPVAAMFIDCIDSMQRGLGDGTTVSMLIASALIDRGTDLIEEGLHPGNVVIGYAMAAARTGEVLDALARQIAPDDRDRLTHIAATSMTADLDDDVRHEYAHHVARAVHGLATTGDPNWMDTDDVKVLVAQSEESHLYDGVIIRRWPGPVDEDEGSQAEFDWSLDFPEPTENVTVAILDREIDFERTATTFGTEDDEWGSGIKLETVEQYSAYRSGFEERIEATVERFQDMGVDMLVSQVEIEGPIRNAFEKAGVSVIDEVKFPLSDVHRIARATGGTVVSHVDDVTPERLGTVGSVVERRVDGEKWTILDGCDGGVFSLVLHCETETETDRHERIVENALEVATMAGMDQQVIPGAGAPAMAVATDLHEYATTIPEREQLAIEAFAEALEETVYVMAENAGLDPIDALIELRTAHANAEAAPAPIGLDIETGEPIDAWEAGIIEPRRVFSQAIETANAAAEQLLTVDAVLFPHIDWETYTPLTEHD